MLLDLGFIFAGTERQLKSTVMAIFSLYVLYTLTLIVVLLQRCSCMNRHFKCDGARLPSVRIRDDGKASQIYRPTSTHWMYGCKKASEHDGEELHSVRTAATQEAPVTGPPLGKLQISHIIYIVAIGSQIRATFTCARLTFENRLWENSRYRIL